MVNIRFFDHVYTIVSIIILCWHIPNGTQNGCETILMRKKSLYNDNEGDDGSYFDGHTKLLCKKKIQLVESLKSLRAKYKL